MASFLMVACTAQVSQVGTNPPGNATVATAWSGAVPAEVVQIAFKNAGELVNALAASDEVSWCASKQWARYMLGRFETPAEMGALMNAYIAASYGNDRVTPRPFSVRDFLVAVVGTKAFRFRLPAVGEIP